MKEGNLLKWEDYYSRYCYYLGEGYSYVGAFEKVQFDFKEQTGVDRVEVINYANIDSFRAAMTYRNNNSTAKNKKK